MVRGAPPWANLCKSPSKIELITNILLKRLKKRPPVLLKIKNTLILGFKF